MQIAKTHFILYTRDQNKSADFYTAVLECDPTLNTPGMTEFALSNRTVLGLMPESGIKALLGPGLPDPESASGIPRAELYLVLSDARRAYMRALEKGAKEISPLARRDWGHDVAYCLDLDGHVLTFAELSESSNEPFQSGLF